MPIKLKGLSLKEIKIEEKEKLYKICGLRVYRGEPTNPMTKINAREDRRKSYKLFKESKAQFRIFSYEVVSLFGNIQKSSESLDGNRNFREVVYFRPDSVYTHISHLIQFVLQQ